MVGAWFAQAWWGTGLNAEAKRLVCLLALTHCGLERLGAYADTGNHRSHAALAKAGFRREGVLRAFHRHGERSKDVAVFSLLRSEWTTTIGICRRIAVRLGGSIAVASGPRGGRHVHRCDPGRFIRSGGVEESSEGFADDF